MSTAAWLPRPPPPPSSAPRWSPPPPASPSPQTPEQLCKNISLLAKKYLPLSRGWRRGWGRMQTPRPPHRWVSRATLAIRITLRILFFEIDVDFSFYQLVDRSWAKAMFYWWSWTHQKQRRYRWPSAGRGGSPPACAADPGCSLHGYYLVTSASEIENFTSNI